MGLDPLDTILCYRLLVVGLLGPAELRELLLQVDTVRYSRHPGPRQAAQVAALVEPARSVLVGLQETAILAKEDKSGICQNYGPPKALVDLAVGQ